MSNITFDYMEEYIRSLIPDHNGVILDLEKYAAENSVPIIHKEVANFLELVINMHRPIRVLELGTAIGYSAILMASCSSSIKKLDTIERDENMIEKAAANVKKVNLDSTINIIKGDCLEVLENLQKKYDLIFVDAGKGHYNHFFPHCMRLLEKNGVIIADNVLFKGMVANRELLKRRKITIVKRMKDYLNMISKDENLITTIIPMGDGIAVTKRRDE